MSGKPLYFPWGNLKNDPLGETSKTTHFGKPPKRPPSTRFLYILKQDNDFGTIQERLDRFGRVEGGRLGGFPKWVVCVVSPSGSFLWFPQKEKGVFRTTGDRGRNFFWGLWIPYGYPKFSNPLQNRRRLPLTRIEINPFWGKNNEILMATYLLHAIEFNKYVNVLCSNICNL